jgi:hypothetical protein
MRYRAAGEAATRKSMEILELSDAEAEALDTLYRTTRVVRLRTRAQIVLLAGEQRLTAPAIARIVRENDETVRRWLSRWLAEGIAGLQDRPMPGGPAKITDAYRERLLRERGGGAWQGAGRKVGQGGMGESVPSTVAHTRPGGQGKAGSRRGRPHDIRGRVSGSYHASQRLYGR